MDGCARVRRSPRSSSSNGAAFSSWYSRLPAIQDRLDLGPGAVGLALLGAPLGLLLAQPAVGAVIARRGSRPLVTASPLYLAAVILAALATSLPTLFVAVTVVGRRTAQWTSR